MHPRNKAAVGLLVTGVPVILAVGLLTNAELLRWPILLTALGLTAVAAYIGRSLLPKKTERAIEAISEEEKHEVVADTPKDKIILWLVIAAAMSISCWIALHFTK
jgi:cytochrome bd-type quinol oxidase subunit 2